MTCRRMLGTIVLMSLVGPGAAVRAQELSEDALARLELRAIGPAVMGGRINDLAVDEQRPWVMYVGAASGGLWKTTNNGTTWTPIFDDQAVASIGDVTLAPSDPEIVWVGTGEANNRQSTTFGNGVYKSTDGGASWEHVGLEQTHHIGRIVIHPSDPATVYVAGGGHLWGANPERGVFKTSDGGNSWDKVLFIDADTGVSDLAIDPVNPRILYATAYQRRRTPWGFSGDGGGSGMYKTTDGGETWRVLTEGLPEGTLGRIGLDIHRADPRIVYATVQHADGGIFRSEDRGEHWTRVNELNPRAMYYSQIRVDPTDDRRVYVLGGSFNYSDDGGETWVQNTDMTPTYDIGVHGDHHALWIDPAHSEHLILGGDGGLYFSWDASITWDKVNNIPLAQFYAIGVDMQTPYWVYGGAQDTHSWGRSQRHPDPDRHSQQRLASDQLRRRHVPASRSDRSEHRLHRVPGRRHRAIRPGQRRSPDDQAVPRGWRRGVPISLDDADCHIAARRESDLCGRQPALHVDRPRRDLECERGPHARRRSRHAAHHG